MGLFDKENDNAKKAKNAPAKRALEGFSIKKTRDVPKLLRDVSQSSRINIKYIDFDVVHVTTEVKLPDSKAAAEIDNEIAIKLQEEGMLTNPKLEISQIYELNLKTATTRKDFNLVVKLVANKTLSRARAIIKKESILKYGPHLEEQIRRELRKIKIRRGMMVDIFEDNMSKGIKALVQKLKEKNKLEQDFSIELCRWVDPEPTIHDDLIKHFEIKREKELSKMAEEERIDYRERGYLITVEPEELVMEYVKPYQGKPGRNCKGEYMEPEIPKITHAPEFIADTQTIEIKDTPRSIFYYAKTKGYVYLDKRELRIANELEINGADFRSTGNIRTKFEEDVTIHLKSNESYEDNIGPNIEVEAKEIKVDGSVANGSIVRAEDVDIKGQTHKTSQIFAENANVNIHRGYLKAREAKIFTLEGGMVEADSVFVTQAAGGIIKGKFVEITALLSNVTITASNEIIITQELKGGDNKLNIEPAVTEEDAKKVQKYLIGIKKKEKEIQELQKKLSSQKATLENAKESMATLKQTILTAKKEGRVPPKALVDRYKKFMSVIEFAKAIQDEINAKKEALNKQMMEIDMIQDAALHAKIINYDGWKTRNKITYRLINPLTTIEYVPPVGTGPCTLVLKEVGENKYKVAIEDIQ